MALLRKYIKKVCSQRKCQVRTQGEGGQLQMERRGFARNQLHLNLLYLQNGGQMNVVYVPRL